MKPQEHHIVHQGRSGAAKDILSSAVLTFHHLDLQISILKLMEPVESRCRRRMAAWTWWRSWTLAQSSGKPPRSESGVQSCSPPCFDIMMDMMDMMYILNIDGGHF